jgi:4-hydroxyphenylacetate 3-monooxygenase
MIRTGEQYRDSIRDGRQVWINGERVKDVTAHPMFRPLVDVRARIYDMQHDPRFADALSYRSAADEVCAVSLKLPRTRDDWHAKREAVEAVLNEIGGVVTRVGDETVGEMWSLFDGQSILDEADPAFSENIRRHVERVVQLDPFHVSANTDPKGDRSKRPQE